MGKVIQFPLRRDETDEAGRGGAAKEAKPPFVGAALGAGNGVFTFWMSMLEAHLRLWGAVGAAPQGMQQPVEDKRKSAARR